MINQYQTLVFDCDGVVLDSNKVKTEAFYEIAKKFGHREAKLLVEYHVNNGGISRYSKIEYFLTHILGIPFNQDLNRDLLERFSTVVKKGLMSCSVSEGLSELKKSTESKWLIASGSDQVELREIFLKRGLEKYFDGGVFGSPDSKSVILKREKASENISGKTLFLGDSKYDLQVSREACIDFLFVSGWTEVENWKSFCHKEKIGHINSISDMLPLKKTQ